MEQATKASQTQGPLDREVLNGSSGKPEQHNQASLRGR